MSQIPFATSVGDIERWLETFDPLPPFDSVPSPIHLICHRSVPLLLRPFSTDV
jgi:hypothetical protein